MVVASRAVCGRRGGDGRNLNAAHQGALCHQIGAHLARADHPDADRSAGIGARLEIAGKAGEVHIGQRDGGDVGLHGAVIYHSMCCFGTEER